MSPKYRVVTERTIVSMLETSVGFSGASGASYYLSRLRNNVGIYLALTGFRLRGFDLKKVGLATHFVDSRRLRTLEKDLQAITDPNEIERLLANYSMTPMTFDSEFDQNLPRIQECFDASSIDEIYERLKKDGSKWSKETIKLLNSKSPTSLKVCHRQLYLGKMLKLTDCLKMEYRIALQHLIIDCDLREGCRAILYENKEPRWNPTKLSDVTKEKVEAFFNQLPDGDELIL
jgi:3-hydroxyisobutyryl-CoA hydrolase